MPGLVQAVLKLVERYGVVTIGQAARVLGATPKAAAELLDALVEKGELKASEVAGVKLYYKDPTEAAEAVLESADLALLSQEDREKLAEMLNRWPGKRGATALGKEALGQKGSQSL